MIDQLNETVKSIEAVQISVPYVSVNITTAGAEMHIDAKHFDKIREEVDPILILTWPRIYCEKYPIERGILIGTVRVFALYKE